NKYQKFSFKNVIDFWTVELPLELYRSKNYMGFALLSFICYIALGWVSSSVYPDFTATVLGEGYVEMTMENIEKGNPLGVYEGSSSFMMFIQITGNNLMVSILTFIAGIFFTLGTQFLLFGNGVMLGAFQHMFLKKGLLITSFLGIWIHGAFEISSIALSAGAGITAGSGWIFPGSFSRLQAFRASFARGAKIMLSILPFIVLAGYLESYVTRNYDTLPDASKWTIILGSFMLIGFLYIFLPIYQAQRYPSRLFEETNFKQPHPETIQLLSVRSIWQVYRQGIVLFFQTLGKTTKPIFKVVFPVGICLIAIRALLYPEDLTFVYWFDWASHLSFMLGYAFITPIDLIISLLWVGLISYTFLISYHILLTKAGLNSMTWSDYIRKTFLRIFFLFLLLLLPIFTLPWYVLLPTLLVYPLLSYLPLSLAFPEQSLAQGVKKGLRYSAKSYGTLLVLMAIGLLTTAAVCQPISAVFSINNEVPDLLDLLVNACTPLLDHAGLNSVFWTNLFRECVYLVVLLFTLIFWFTLLSLSYFSMLEKREAVNLKMEAKHFGERSRLKEYVENQDQ
ncbi:MAG: stage II sporulation protein M, partial [Flavobacteriales bacterium]